MGETEHRCRRCGRRPDDTLMPVVHGALAAQISPAPADASVTHEQQPQPPRVVGPPVQRPLFQSDKVIQFPAPLEPRKRPQPEAGKTGKAQPRRPRQAPENQGNLDFFPALTAKPRTLPTTVEAKVYCEAPVAARLHRAIAAALDWSMVLIGYGLFLLVFRLAGGEFFLNRPNLLVFGGSFALVAFAYGFVWAIAGSVTAGMRWTGLQLMGFDGFPPDLRQRIIRFGASCLSVCTVLGLVWSLADEESLTWQDHISTTFPTPLASETQVFRRR